jgi:hypothetical protein
MKMHRFAAILTLMLLPLSLSAKPKEKLFDAPPDEVYAAVQKVIREHYVVTFTDDKQMLVSFKTPQTFTANPMEGNVAVEAENGKSRLTANVNKGNIGAAGHVEDNILKWVGEELDKKPTIEYCII